MGHTTATYRSWTPEWLRKFRKPFLSRRLRNVTPSSFPYFPFQFVAFDGANLFVHRAAVIKSGLNLLLDKKLIPDSCWNDRSIGLLEMGFSIGIGGVPLNVCFRIRHNPVTFNILCYFNKLWSLMHLKENSIYVTMNYELISFIIEVFL